jgi:type II secretory ATPase GspE/PulE/Tfp pilus assembly ATPase PilB-like protein
MCEGKKIFRGRGCPSCLNTGFKGRTGIFELMILDEPLRDIILESADANTLKNEAVKAGMVTLRQDGASKVLDGVTTIEEVFRVTHQ